MKKIILSSMLFAAAAIALVSCHKSETAPEKKLVSLTFTSANPDTKTEYNGETIVWSKGDIIRMACTANGVWQDQDGDITEGEKAKLYISNPVDLSEASETATFTIADYFKTDATSGPYQFYTVYPSAATGSEKASFTAPYATVTIPATQNSTATTFDKSADLLWGKAVNTYDARPTEQAIPLLWTRVVAHAYITLNGIKGIVEEETIKNVILTANEDAALVGTYNLNMTDGTITPKTSANSLKISCADITADSKGNVSFWACINPCEVTSLDIVVETNLASYSISKPNISLTFVQNRRNILPVDMSEATRKSDTKISCTLIENIDGIVEGEYVIASEDGAGNYFAATTELTSSAFTGIEFSVEDNNLVFSGISSVPTFNITRNNDTISICNADGDYLTNGNSGTALSWKNTTYSWNIYSTEDIPYIVQSSTQATRALKYDKNSNAFKGYLITATGQYRNLILFKKN